MSQANSGCNWRLDVAYCALVTTSPVLARLSPADHRGTVDFPGRTLTLEPSPGAVTVRVELVLL